jgi:hypothetical protein
MALRFARGLFRLWLVLSVLWIGGVGVVTWRTLPDPRPPLESFLEHPERNPPPPGYVIDPPSSSQFNPAEYLAFKAAAERRAAIWHASLLAFLPPAFVLGLGSALVWAFKGFR